MKINENTIDYFGSINSIYLIGGSPILFCARIIFDFFEVLLMTNLVLLTELKPNNLFKINTISGDLEEIDNLAKYNFREGKTFIVLKTGDDFIVEDYVWGNVLCIRTNKVNILCELL